VVTRRLAEALLRLAARRWPAGIRAELHHEWLAEVHVLASRRREMLAYAASLAVSRPVADPLLDRSAMTRTALRTAALLLLAPLAGVATTLAGFIVMNVLVNGLFGGPRFNDPLLGVDLQLPVATVFIAVFGVGLALLARRRARRSALTGPLLLAVALALPVGIVAILGVALGSSASEVQRTAPELALWVAGMVLVLWLAARAAAEGDRRRAWWLGILGAIVVANAAFVLTVLSQTLPPGAVLSDGSPADGVNRAWAPLWLLTCFTGSTFGLPGPTDWEIFRITDDITVTPYLYLAVTPYLLAYAINAARRAQERPGRQPGRLRGRRDDRR
jgi:hypothetical protein